MKVYLNKAQQDRDDGQTFAGSFPPKEIELTDETIDAFGLREPLTRLLTATLQQMNERGHYKGRVRSADVTTIGFTLWLEPQPRRRS